MILRRVFSVPAQRGSETVGTSGFRGIVVKSLGTDRSSSIGAFTWLRARRREVRIPVGTVALSVPRKRPDQPPGPPSLPVDGKRPGREG
jgi:hypothetical protein